MLGPPETGTLLPLGLTPSTCLVWVQMVRRHTLLLTYRRSKDGLTLYAVSSDGTMAVFSFDATEMEGIAPQSAQEQYLKRFGFVATPLPEGYSHQGSIEPEPRPIKNGSHMTPPPSPRAKSQDFDSAANAHAALSSEHINTLVA